MYYVIVFLALIVVIAVLIVLRTVASYPQRDEAEQVEQSEPPATRANLAAGTPVATEEQKNASLSEESPMRWERTTSDEKE
ncbi:MAG: hypothetical protein M3Y39_16560 [Chloroflexota bacterium]|nr:hypothetical protein [Chloroflexota bacterium]